MSETREWLIRKDGYYYRPNCQGYTTRKLEAGRYTKAEAEREAAVEPWHMKAIHQDDVPDEPAVVDLHASLAAAQEEIERLKRERDEARAERKLISDQLRPLIPEGQNPEQADSVYGIIGFMYIWKRLAEAAEADNARLREDGASFLSAVDALCDWLNGNDISSDHADEKPEDFKLLCDTMVAFRTALQGGKDAR